MKIETVCDNRTFQRAYRKGKKHAGQMIVVYALRSQKPHAPKLGLTVTKGRGSAVVRNRIKRILRAAYRDVAERRRVADGHEIIIVARDAAITAKTHDVVPELEHAFDVLGVFEP